MSAGIVVGLVALALVLINLASMLLAARRWLTRPLQTFPKPSPAVSIVRPLCGLETFSRETLEATFRIDWPEYEILFCVQNARDPVVALVEQIIVAHPERRARLLIGDDLVSANPKLNNCVKGWNAARHDYVVIADSNALTPPDYIARMIGVFREDTALVVSMPLGTRPDGFFADIECAVLNTYQARWQYAAEAIGMGFAQGKNMMWRRAVLERAGGICALAGEIAEDAASTKVARAQGLRVRLVARPFEQPLGPRRAREVWARHSRWARLRRITFPLHFTPEILTGAFLPATLAAFASREFGLGAMTGAVAVLAVLYVAEAALAALARFPLSWTTPAAFVVRDLALPVMWLDAWLSDDFVWHGQTITGRARSDQASEDFA
ncbi:MAG: glycosyltransferase [Hyphomicrobiales bacterium]|nr:glycosyltransferase [Hyphomicrobiales bacterium]